MSKNVAVFVDVANIFYAAKAAGVDIDYVTLLKASSAGRDLVRAYAYTGLDPENENQRNFHDFLRRHGYKVVSKDIRKYGDGKVKANLDIELVVDMMKTARNLDIAIVVSGDGDFAPAIRAVQEQGVRVEVVSFRGNTSSDLMDVADQFTDITQIAKVEKGSSRSGRRVADDELDLSMTEVPEKQSEGTGDRARGRGRGRRTAVAASSGSTRTRGRATAETREAREPREALETGGTLVVLPGERLSRVAATAAAPSVVADEAELEEPLEAMGTEDGDGEGEGGEAGEERRRRRRRGGRGRGRGRGREGYGDELGAREPAGREPAAEAGYEEEAAPPAPARRAASSFGSVWDSQIGIQAGARREPVVADEEDLEEPEIPEYLLTERRQRDGGRGRGGRGGGRGGAYAAALERERFGGGRGSTPSRYAEPPRREGGYNRPDRDRGGRSGRDDRSGFRGEPRPAPRGTSEEPWSEVPPEIEAMLRAQLGSRAGGGPRPAARRDEPAPEAAEVAPVASEAPAERRPRARRAPAPASASEAAVPAEAPADAAESAAPSAPRTTRSRSRKAATPAEIGEAVATGVDVPVEPAAKRTRTSRTSATSGTTTRRSRASATDAASAVTPLPESGATATTEPAEAAAPKRRTTRRKAEPAA